MKNMDAKSVTKGKAISCCGTCGHAEGNCVCKGMMAATKAK